MMKAAYLAEPLVFAGGFGTQLNQATAQLTQPMPGLYKNSILVASTGNRLFVMKVSGALLQVVRIDRIRSCRYFGGLPYRQWSRKANSYDDEGELIGEYVPAPRRARPLKGRRRHWPDTVLPTGTPLVLINSAYAEGSHV